MPLGCRRDHRTLLINIVSPSTFRNDLFTQNPTSDIRVRLHIESNHSVNNLHDGDRAGPFL